MEEANGDSSLEKQQDPSRQQDTPDSNVEESEGISQGEMRRESDDSASSPLQNNGDTASDIECDSEGTENYLNSDFLMALRHLLTGDLYMQLLCAMQAGDDNAQSGICDRIKAAIQSQGDDEATAMVLRAARETDLTVLRFLLENFGADCLKLIDADGDTIVQKAARLQGEESGPAALELMVEKLGSGCLRLEGFKRRKAVHSAAWNRNSPAALFWLIDHLEPHEFTADADAANFSALQYAFYAQNPSTLQLLIERDKGDCLSIRGPMNRTVYHISAMNPENPATLLWLIETQEPEAFLTSDSENSCAIHYAFKYQNGDTVQHLVSKLDIDCLKLPGALKRTAAHYAALNERSPSALLWLIETQDPEVFLTGGSDNTTALHLALLNQDANTVKKLLQKVSTKALSMRGYRNRTAAHYAVRNENSEHVFALLFDSLPESNRAEILNSADADGKTCLHFCTLNRALGVQMFERSFSRFGFSRAANAVKESSDNEGRNPLFTACLAKNFAFLKADFINLREHQCTDTEGNTLLHALFLIFDPLMSFAIDSSQLVEAARKLIEADFNSGAENSMKRNCLLASEIDESSLNEILTNLAHSDLKETFRKLQRNSEGLHAAHVFSSRYNIKTLETSLCQLCDLSPDQLIKVQVLDGPMKDATCLHFACEAGQKENMTYLISKGIKLTVQTVSGQTCVDFAYNKGKLHALSEVASSAGVDLSELLRLVDPAWRALQLPDRQSARNLLTLFTDPALRSNIEKDRNSQKMVDTAGSHTASRESPEVKMLIRALELDSNEMLRSLITLNFVIDDIDDQVMKYLLTQGDNEADSENKISLKALDKFKLVSKEMVEHFTLIECAIFFDKAKLLEDLMLLPQFDIIPETLRLLIHLRPKVKLLKNAQLTRVSNKALSVVSNVLEHLYVNADSSQRKFLFKFLTANFTDSNGVAGPKFSSPLQALTEAVNEEEEGDDDIDNEGKEEGDFLSESCCKPKSNKSKIPKDRKDIRKSECVSVMELMDTLDCDDLFATDCISQLVDSQWKRPPPLPWAKGVADHCSSCNRRSGMKINQRMLMYSICYIIFLIFFAWYVTDFGRSLYSPAADVILLMYALSFTLQEVNDMVSKWSTRDVYIRQRRIRIHRYFTDLFNYFDMIGILLLWSGLILKLLGRLSDPSLLRSCQMVLSTSYLFLGFRSVALLSYFKVTGPKISMLKSLLFKDLAPFMLIMLVLIYSFGVFFFNLLFPTISGVRNAESVVTVFTLPVSLAFGFFENAQFVSCNSTGQANWDSCAELEGNKAFSRFLVFVYLVFVNIVMWNLLIALFNLTVIRMASKAEVLWRKTLFELLQEFSEVSPVPPPLSFPHYAWKLMRKYRSCTCSCTNPASVSPSADDKQPLWQIPKTFAAYPEDFQRFLTFQAEQLRQHRPRLLRAVERHRSDADALRAHTENEMAGMRELVGRLESEIKGKLASEMKEQVGKLESIQLRQRKRAKRQGRKMEQKLASLEQQMSEMLSLLRQQRTTPSS